MKENIFIKVQILVLVLGSFHYSIAKVSDERLCADPECNTVIGTGKTVLKYFAKDEGMLSFANNKPVKIFSKGSGSNPDLWGVMIDGRRGYVNKAHIQEQRVYQKDLKFKIPTEFYKTGANEDVRDNEKDNNAQDQEILEVDKNVASEDNKTEDAQTIEEEQKAESKNGIEKTENPQEFQFETKNPELASHVESPSVEVASGISSVESQSFNVDATASSTPPIDASLPPSQQSDLSSASPEEVQPDTSGEYEVVDGTTIYFNDPPPKINEAPSMDNVTPEAIAPTATLSGARPTETRETPEIESSVSDDIAPAADTGAETAALSDNPGSSPTTNAGEAVSQENIELTDPASVEELKTVSPNQSGVGANVPDNVEIQADKVPENIEKVEDLKVLDIDENKDIGENNGDNDEEEIQDDDYVDELTEEQMAKLKNVISELKNEKLSNEEPSSDESVDDTLNATMEFTDNEETTEEIRNDFTENYANENNDSQNVEVESVSVETNENPNDEPPHSQTQEENHEPNMERQESTEAESKSEFEDSNADKQETNQSTNEQISNHREDEQIESHHEQEDHNNSENQHDDHNHEHESQEENKNDLQVQEARIDDHDYQEDHENQGVPNQENVHENEHVEAHDQDHSHSHDHGHGDSHTHEPGHSHENSHDHGPSHSHSHSHDHGHGNSHTHEPGHSHDDHGHRDSHDHGHEHSHDHGHGHSHTHGLDHLGRGVQQRVPEEIPIHYKPAEQQFDLPLSAQFAQSSHYSSSNYDNVDVTTTPAPADVDPNINDEVFTPAYQTTPATPVDDVSIDGSIHQEQEEPSIDETKDQDEGGIFSSISSMFGSSTESSQVQTGDNPEVGDQDIKENAENKEANIQQFDDLQNPNQDEATREEAVEMTSDENVNENSQTDEDPVHEKVDTYVKEDENDPGSETSLDDQAVESEQEDVLGDSQLERDDSVVQEPTYLDPEEQIRDGEGLEFNEDMNLGQQEVTDEGLAISQQSQDTNTLHEAEDTSHHHHQYEEHPRQQEDQYHQDENHHQEDQGHNHSSSEDQLFPDWFAVLIHDHAIIDGDRLALVAIISVTLLLLHLINSFINKSSREQPLIKRLADLDRKLFAATNELLILKKEQAESIHSVVDSGGNNIEALREVELQLQQTCAELETSRETLKMESDRTNRILSELESSKQDTVAAQEEAKQAQEMVEELIQNQGSKTGSGADDQLMAVVQQLQSQLESQKVVLGKYEPRLKRKEKENRELTNQIKQLKADFANANLEKEKVKKELTDTMRSVEESSSKLNEVFKNEEEWKSLSDLLQSQLDEKNLAISDMETEMSSLKSRIAVFKNEAESKEEQLEVLQETLDELHNRSGNKSVTNGDSGNGWDVEEEDNGWEVEDIEQVKELARLKVENKRNVELKDAMEKELSDLQKQLETTSTEMERFKSEAGSLRDARDEVVKDHSDLQRRMEVLTEFFNKKEAELQRQLGLQSAKFGDVSCDAESSARQLVCVTSELENTKDQVRIIKTELEDQERSLKSAVAAQEKKAHENWVAARQAERKLTELQGELSLLRNKLTVFESRNQLLEQEKSDLTETVNMLKGSVSVKSEPVVSNGLNGAASLDSLPGPSSPSGPESLPPLPGLPGMSTTTLPPALPTLPLLSNPMMVPPMFGAGGILPMEMRQPPLGGRMSPGPRDSRSYGSRSPSPEYDRGYRGGGSGRYRDRDASPTSRSERRISPTRHRGASPARSERQYYSGGRGDRYYDRRSSRDGSGDRFSSRSERSDRGGDRYRDDRDERLNVRSGGPKTSTPGDPPRGYTRA